MVQNSLWQVGNMGIFSAESEVVGVPKSCGNAAPLRTLSWWVCEWAWAWVCGCVRVGMGVGVGLGV